MSARRSDLLDQRYRQHLALLLERVRERLGDLYDGRIDYDDLDASFVVLAPEIAALVRAAQSAGVALTTGYLSALVSIESGRRVPPIERVISDLADLIDGLDAIPSMVKQRIVGVERQDALNFGRFLIQRFGDAEVTRAIDDHTDAMTRSGDFSGWEGVVSAKACNPCRGNAGFHELSEPIYRHGSCNCTKQYVVATQEDRRDA